MNYILRRCVLLAILLGVVTAGAAYAEPNRVTFPSKIEEFVHYSTVTRGEDELMLTSREAMEAAQQGLPMPEGSHVVIEFRQNGEVTRYFVMQKGTGWGEDYDEGRRTGDWQFQAYNADRTVNLTSDSARCQSCHQARADTQHQFMFDDLLRFE